MELGAKMGKGKKAKKNNGDNFIFPFSPIPLFPHIFTLLRISNNRSS